MTNIIEQMYKEYGVEPIQDNIGNGLYNCYYPPFAAQKQIKLLEFLSIAGRINITDHEEGIIISFVDDIFGTGKDLQEALVTLIYNLKICYCFDKKLLNQVKEILKG